MYHDNYKSKIHLSGVPRAKQEIFLNSGNIPNEIGFKRYKPNNVDSSKFQVLEEQKPAVLKRDFDIRFKRFMVLCEFYKNKGHQNIAPPIITLKKSENPVRVVNNEHNNLNNSHKGSKRNWNTFFDENENCSQNNNNFRISLPNDLQKFPDAENYIPNSSTGGHFINAENNLLTNPFGSRQDLILPAHGNDSAYYGFETSRHHQATVENSGCFHGNTTLNEIKDSQNIIIGYPDENIQFVNVSDNDSTQTQHESDNYELTDEFYITPYNNQVLGSVGERYNLMNEFNDLIQYKKKDYNGASNNLKENITRESTGTNISNENQIYYGTPRCLNTEIVISSNSKLENADNFNQYGRRYSNSVQSSSVTPNMEVTSENDFSNKKSNDHDNVDAISKRCKVGKIDSNEIENKKNQMSAASRKQIQKVKLEESATDYEVHVKENKTIVKKENDSRSECLNFSLKPSTNE